MDRIYDPQNPNLHGYRLYRWDPSLREFLAGELLKWWSEMLWSRSEVARKLYVNERDGPREMTVCFNRPARDLRYPLFFKQTTTLSHAGTSAHKQDGAATGVGSSNS